MALSSAATAVKQGLLRHLRMPLQQACSSSNVGAGLGLSLWRGFAGGGYLDKDEVTQRVLEVTKHFEKINPAKVRPVEASVLAPSGVAQIGADLGPPAAQQRLSRYAHCSSSLERSSLY